MHGIWSKSGHFSAIFCLAIQAIKMCFMIFSNEETTFKVINKRSSKRRKTDIFPKGLIHGFGPKLAIFPPYFFQAIYAIKMCFMIFQKKKTRFQAIKTTSLKSRNIDIFPNGLVQLVLTQYCPFFHHIVLGNIGQENVFYDILERKNAFLGYNKTRISKSRNIDIFPKGLVRLVLVQNCPFLHHFF